MCNQQQSHRQLQSHNSFSTSRGRFLPLLCRLSIKDVKLPKWPEYSDRSSSSSSSASPSSSNDPTSPKVSCIGQVKKRKNSNKFISCPIQHKSADSNLRYAKLRKLFSGKNLLTNGVVNATVETNTTHSCKMMIRNGTSTAGARLIRMPPPPPPPQRKILRSCRSDDHEIVNILDLDPPLPVVIKKVQQCGRDDQVNLWKRRCGGGAGNGKISLRSLQIEQIHVPNNHHIPPTTV